MANQEKVITEEDIGVLLDELANATKGEVDENINFIQLKMAADNFLKQLDILDSQEEAIIKEARKRYTADRVNFYEGVLNVNNKKNSKTFIMRSKYRLAFEFDAYLNTFLGGLPKSILTVIQIPNGNPDVQTYEISMQELINLLNRDARIILTAKGGKLTGALQNIIKNNRSLEEDEDNKLMQDHILRVQQAYAGSQARLERYYQKHKGSQKQSGILMWQDGNSWVLARVLNYGDLKEAYAAALMAEHQKDIDYLCNVGDPGGPIYYSHSLIEAFFIYINAVDNAGALEHEDIVTKSQQYGVKSQKASMPGLQQYIDLAKQIIKLPDNEMAPKDTIKSLIESKPAAKRNIILGRANSSANFYTDNLMNILLGNAANGRYQTVDKETGEGVIQMMIQKYTKKV